jgi:hypothetical protein
MTTKKRPRCSELDPDLFTEDTGTNFARAVHECYFHCEVRDACLRAAYDDPAYVAGTVRGGLVWAESHKRGEAIAPAVHQPFPVGCHVCNPRMQRRTQKISREALDRMGAR